MPRRTVDGSVAAAYSSRMSAPLACVMCMVDAGAATLIGPLAQATVIVVPFVFRREVSAAVRRVRARKPAPTDQNAVDLPKAERPDR
jgi:hypothetical protein